MHFSLRTTLVLVATTAVAAGACGGNVVVDSTSAGTANGGTTTASTTFTAVTGFSTTDTGFGTTGTGFGGSETTGTGFGGSETTGTGFGGSETTGFGTTATVSVTSSTGTGMGGAPCTDGTDLSIFDSQVIYPALVDCVKANLGNPGGEQMCIQAKVGLTPLCAKCVVADLDCSVTSCASVCLSDPNGENCIGCRNTQCEPQFVGCSGFPQAPGSASCADTLLAGTKGAGWVQGLPPEAFVTDGANAAYQIVDTCACSSSASGSCFGKCSGSNPDFCTGGVASDGCLACIESACGTEMMKCDAN
jgi:hypothetical protein